MKSALVIITFLISTSSVFSQLNLDSGLIAYYPFNNDLRDSSKNHYNATLIDGTFAADRFGNPNSAIYFDGKDDYATIKKFGKYIYSKDLTIALWAKSIKSVTSNTMMLMPDNTSNRIALSLYYSHNGQGAFFWDYAGISSRIFIEPVNPDNSWEFFVVYFNSKTQKVGLYKNNNLLQEVSNSNSFTMDSTKALHIGTGKDGSYNGTLDDIRFYNRLLSQKEMKALFEWKNANLEPEDPKDNLEILINNTYGKTLTISSRKEIDNIRIFSSTGQLIRNSTETVIDVSNFPSGVYYITISDNLGRHQTRKVML